MKTLGQKWYHLDNETKIQESLSRLIKEKTVIVIAAIVINGGTINASFSNPYSEDQS